MSHFYGTLQGQAGEATRCGSKRGGLTTYAASWAGAIKVEIWHNETTGQDEYLVQRTSWQGRGDSKVVASGIVGGARRKKAA